MSNISQFMGAGGAGAPVGICSTFHSADPIITLGDGSRWLRSGYTVPTSQFPDLTTVAPVVGDTINTTITGSPFDQYNNYARGNGIHVRIFTGGDVQRSVDGITWVSCGILGTSVAFGNGIFIVVNVVSAGNLLSVSISSNGTQWNGANVGNYYVIDTIEYRQITFGGGTFVISANANGTMYTCSDSTGTIWLSNNSNPFVGNVNTATTLPRIWFCNNKWVVLSTDGRVRLSTDLQTWVVGTAQLFVSGEHTTNVSGDSKIFFFNGKYVVLYLRPGATNGTLMSTLVTTTDFNSIQFIPVTVRITPAVNVTAVGTVAVLGMGGMTGVDGYMKKIMYLTPTFELRSVSYNTFTDRGNFLNTYAANNYLVSYDSTSLTLLSTNGVQTCANFPSATSVGLPYMMVYGQTGSQNLTSPVVYIKASN